MLLCRPVSVLSLSVCLSFSISLSFHNLGRVKRSGLVCMRCYGYQTVFPLLQMLGYCVSLICYICFLFSSSSLSCFSPPCNLWTGWLGMSAHFPFTLHKVWKVTRESLQLSKTRIKAICDKKAVPHSFNPGEQVLALLPGPGSSLTARVEEKRLSESM